MYKLIRIEVKFYEERLIETLVNKICDVCKESVMIKLNGENYKESS